MLVNPEEALGLTTSKQKPGWTPSPSLQPPRGQAAPRAAPLAMGPATLPSASTPKPAPSLSWEGVYTLRWLKRVVMTLHATYRHAKPALGAASTVVSAPHTPAETAEWRTGPCCPPPAVTPAGHYLTTSYCRIRGRSSAQRVSLSCSHWMSRFMVTGEEFARGRQREKDPSQRLSQGLRGHRSRRGKSPKGPHGD